MDGPADNNKRSAFKDLWQIIGFLKPFKAEFLILMVVVTTMNVTMLARPYAVGVGINCLTRLEGARASGHQIFLYVGIPVAIYLVFGLVTASLWRIRPVVGMTLSVALLRKLRTMVYNKTQQLSFNYLDRLTNGQIIERATGDVTAIQNFLTMSFVQVFDAVVTIGVMLAFMISMNARLALIAIAPFPLVAFLFAKVTKLIRVRSRLTRDQVDEMTTRLTEGIAGVRVIRSFGAEEIVKRQYRKTLWELYHRAMRTFRIRCFGLIGVFEMSRLIQVLLVAYGGALVIHDKAAHPAHPLELGFFAAYLFYVGMLVMKLQPLMQAGDSAQEARAAFERIMALMDVQPDVVDAPDATSLIEGGGRVEFRDVSFAYQDAPAPEADVTERMVIETPPRTPHAIHKVTLDIAAGEIVALVGPTGAGKSTVVSMLPRFYDPTEGRIFIDGQDIRTVRLEDLRRNIGLVFQETFLFRGTIAENIAYGLPKVDRAEIRVAARLAQADPFIRELPMGYNSEIGERGVTLSGGQRQRLAIARAILMKPRVLILDDATASVDAKTEYEIRQGLKDLMAGRTTLIIAHRLPTIRAADRVVVLHDGCVEDVGVHEELMERNEFYRTLCQTQMEELNEGLDPTEGGGASA